MGNMPFSTPFLVVLNLPMGFVSGLLSGQLSRYLSKRTYSFLSSVPPITLFGLITLSLLLGGNPPKTPNPLFWSVYLLVGNPFTFLMGWLFVILHVLYGSEMRNVWKILGGTIWFLLVLMPIWLTSWFGYLVSLSYGFILIVTGSRMLVLLKHPK